MSDKVLKLDTDTCAWNIDGSSSSQLEFSSWINHWEKTTGLKKGLCSYSDCKRQAQCGGHIWISQKGSYIAPICAKCNFCENTDRMQGSGAKLRSGTSIISTPYTCDMRYAKRRIVYSYERKCSDCSEDITDHPDNHKLCLQCYHGNDSDEEECSDYSDYSDFSEGSE